MRKSTSFKKAYVGPLGLQRMSTLIQIDLKALLMADLRRFFVVLIVWCMNDSSAFIQVFIMRNFLIQFLEIHYPTCL